MNEYTDRDNSWEDEHYEHLKWMKLLSHIEELLYHHILGDLVDDVDKPIYYAFIDHWIMLWGDEDCRFDKYAVFKELFKKVPIVE